MITIVITFNPSHHFVLFVPLCSVLMSCLLAIVQLGVRFSRLKFRDRDLSMSTPRVLLPTISCILQTLV